MGLKGFRVDGTTVKYEYGSLEGAPIIQGTGRDSLLVVNGTDPNTASGSVSFAAGAGTEASGYVSTAIGALSIASGIGSFAGGRKASSIEYPTTASGQDSFAFGLSAKATGNKSVAFGQVTNALANMAFAAGNQTTASGTSSFAMGNQSTASGASSVAIGTQNTASEECAVALGEGNTASGEVSAAIGVENVASGNNSFAIGNRTVASGQNSFSGGTYVGSTGDITEASGDQSFAFGLAVTASGNKSVAFGQQSAAVGNASFAAGSHSTAGDGGAVAFGQYASAGAKMSVAMGDHTSATGRAATVFGAYNVADSNPEDISHGAGARKYLFTIGNGTADNARSNAMTVDWDGNVVAAGKLTVGTAPTADMDVATKKYVDDNSGGGGGSKLITFTQLDATPSSSSNSGTNSSEFASTAYTFRATNAYGTYCIEGSYDVATPTGYNLDAGTTTNKPVLPVSITFAKQFQITCTNYSTYNTVLYGDAITVNVWFDGLENLTSPKVFSIASTGVVSILPTTSGTVTVNGQTKNALHFSTNGLYYFAIYDEANGSDLEAYLQTASGETIISGRVDCKTDEFADALSTGKAISVLYGDKYSYLQSHDDASDTTSPIMAAFYGDDEDERYSLEFPIPTAKYLLIVGKKTSYASAGGTTEIFWATYGTTTSAEIEAAYQAGKIVCCDYDGRTYVMSMRESATKHRLASALHSGVNTLVCSADTWSTSNRSIPQAYTSTPAALGTAAAGSATTWARGDHVHAMPSASDVGAAPAITEVTVATDGAVTQALDAGKMYHFTGALTSLTITLTAPQSGEKSHYHFDFVSGATAATLTMPNTVIMPDGFSVQANKRYEVDVLNGYGMVTSWTIST